MPALVLVKNDDSGYAKSQKNAVFAVFVFFFFFIMHHMITRSTSKKVYSRQS